MTSNSLAYTSGKMELLLTKMWKAEREPGCGGSDRSFEIMKNNFFCEP